MIYFWACPSLRLGRATAHYAIASVLRFAAHRANARPSHASRKKNQRLFKNADINQKMWQIITLNIYSIVLISNSSRKSKPNTWL
ncbi:MAG: hypothetical protein NZ455_02470 [Bacteroidia bacterium]|nr:hypothetical protein [Bacteroidia bacterium]MDW8346392.1 hypothetical protein [Bacteroidia bacterium]